MNTIAVVVTHNRKDKVLRCIKAIQTQTQPVNSILVIDNASTDGTRQAILDLNDTRIRLETQYTNLGAAAGFELGQELAYDAGYEHVWLCDDDCYPGKNCLQLLTAGIQGLWSNFSITAGFAAPRVTDPWAIDGGSQQNLRSMPIPFTDFTRFYKAGLEIFAIEKASFVNLLIPSVQFKLHGFSRGDYGIWYDDYEWTQRVSHTSTGIFVPAATALHDVPRPKPGEGSITDDNLYKHICNLRNWLSHELETKGMSAYTSACVNMMDSFIRDEIPQHQLNQLREAMLDALYFKPKIKYPKDHNSNE